MEKQLFKSLTNLTTLRREILESSKSVIYNLKSYQKLVEIRQEKKELMKQLRLQIDEITVLMDSLKDKFPVEVIGNYKNKKSGKKNSKSARNKKIVEPSELAKLENKLSDIESKLKTLS